MDKTRKDYDMIKVLLLGPFVVDETHAIHSYLAKNNHGKILIDLVPIQKLEDMIVSLTKHTMVEELTHIVIQNVLISTIDVIVSLIQRGFKGQIITNKYFARQIEMLI